MIRLINERRSGDDEAGLTLVEVLVSMGLLLIVLGVVMTTTVTALRNERGVNARSQNAGSASVAANRMSEVLREAIDINKDATASFTSAGSSSLTVYSEINTLTSGSSTVSRGPTAVTFSLGTDSTRCPAPDYCLLETDTPTVSGTDSTGATAWVPGSTSTVRALVHNVSSSPAQQLFTYYQTTSSDSGNDAAPHLTTSQIALSSGAVPSSSLSSISMVEIFIAIRDASDTSAPATSVDTRVFLPNSTSYANSASTS
jgi:type II secretory pathway pseudopilin PulG